MTKGATCLFLLAVLWGCQGRGEVSDANPVETIDDAALVHAEERTADWLTHGRTYGEQRFSPLDQIHQENVGQLGLAWSFDTGTDRGLEATPIVVDGVLYTTGTWSVVYAVDARSGRLLWKWDPEVPREVDARACCEPVNRGVAVYRGKVYVGILDGRLAALDAGTGSPVWEVLTVDPSQPYTITGAPRVVKGQVIIGNGGAEYGVRGYVSAYDADTGALNWRFYTVPGDPSKPFESEAMKRAAETWRGEWWRYGGGGTVWDSLAYDPELDLLYVGTGNGSPWNRHIRSPGGGDNLYLASILALDPDNGELVWYYQTTPGDHWDYTATQHMILADLPIDGTTRPVLMQAPKNGFFYVLDRRTGELISAKPYVTITWATGIDPQGRPIETPAAEYLKKGAVVKPGPLGGHNWQPMSFHPETGLVYIPVKENLRYYSHVDPFEFRPEQWNTGVGVDDPPESLFDVIGDPEGFLVAWDPVRQEARWKVTYPTYWNGGTLSTGGNLVFQGTAAGDFIAYRASDGQRLWQVWTGTGIVAAPVTYMVDGTQYVSVMAGWGGAFARRVRNEGKIYTFALGATGALPERAPPPVVEPLPEAAASEVVAGGKILFRVHCARCHAGGTTLTDLRYSEEGVFNMYRDIVLDGIWDASGMISFGDKLSEDEVMAIRAFVISERNKIARKSE